MDNWVHILSCLQLSWESIYILELSEEIVPIELMIKAEQNIDPGTPGPRYFVAYSVPINYLNQRDIFCWIQKNYIQNILYN